MGNGYAIGRRRAEEHGDGDIRGGDGDFLLGALFLVGGGACQRHELSQVQRGDVRPLSTTRSRYLTFFLSLRFAPAHVVEETGR